MRMSLVGEDIFTRCSQDLGPWILDENPPECLNDLDNEYTDDWPTDPTSIRAFTKDVLNNFDAFFEEEIQGGFSGMPGGSQYIFMMQSGICNGASKASRHGTPKANEDGEHLHYINSNDNLDKMSLPAFDNIPLQKVVSSPLNNSSPRRSLYTIHETDEESEDLSGIRR